MSGMHASWLPDLSTLAARPRASRRVPTGMQQPQQNAAPPDPPLQPADFGPEANWDIDMLSPDQLAEILGKSLQLEELPTDPNAGFLHTVGHMNAVSTRAYRRMICRRALQLQLIAKGTKTKTVMLQLYKDLALLMQVDPVELTNWENDNDAHYARVKRDVEERCKYFMFLSYGTGYLLQLNAMMSQLWGAGEAATYVLKFHPPGEPAIATLARAVWYCKNRRTSHMIHDAIHWLFRMQHQLPESQAPFGETPTPFPTHGLYTLMDEAQPQTALWHFLNTQTPLAPVGAGVGMATQGRLTDTEISELINDAVQMNLPHAVDELREERQHTLTVAEVSYFVRDAVNYANGRLLLAVMHRDHLKGVPINGNPQLDVDPETWDVYAQADMFVNAFSRTDTPEKAALLYLPFEAATLNPFVPAHPELFQPNPNNSLLIANQIEAHVKRETKRLGELRYDHLLTWIKAWELVPENPLSAAFSFFTPPVLSSLANIPGHPLTQEQLYTLVWWLLGQMPDGARRDTRVTRQYWAYEPWYAATAKLFPLITAAQNRDILRKDYPNVDFKW